MIFDDRRCELGEGPLWHPLRKQLFWFDIIGKRLMSTEAQVWQFDEHVSAAGWVGLDELLIASETALFRFDLTTGTRTDLVALESDRRQSRSNDGRADPQGGFWIGTMGKGGDADPGVGSIWRFYRGELRRLYPNITISNAISFTPDGRTAQFSDTVTGRVMRVGLDSSGWPLGTPEIYLDLKSQGINPDGAVCDATGNLWLAEWGSSRVACYAPDGTFLRAVGFDAPNTSCPAFGGPDLTTLYCTTAQQHMTTADRAAHPHAGKTFAATGVAQGQAEHRVIL